MEGSEGAMGALNTLKINCFFAFPARGVLGDPWYLEVPGGSLGVPGTSLGGSEWCLGVDLMMFLWSPKVYCTKWFWLLYIYCKQYLKQI